jgi:hypothetical protein
MLKSFRNTILGLVLLAGFSCTKEENTPAKISLFSATLDGSSLVDGLEGIDTEPNLVLVFSKAIDAVKFESAFSISPSPTALNFEYASQSSRVTVQMSLTPQTTYQMEISDAVIGADGEMLDGDFEFTFTTKADGTIFSLPPCTSASNDCLQTMVYENDAIGELDFYASYPIYEENAEWQELEAAIIVVHGANRNADDYFSFMMTTLQQVNLDDKVALLAPHFKNNTEAAGAQFYWTNTGWRAGNNSLDPARVSSFELTDALINRLADTTHFPVLKNIIVTGHSSGGLFTHLFTAANTTENQYPGITFDYICANSQYFYYPGDERIDETSNELFTPSGCSGYNFYPTGYNAVPEYVATTGQSEFNERFIHRSLIYLLGNGNTADPTLNTSDCFATLLGSSRYQRGENMYRYMELKYAGTHNHSKTVVDGVGHDGRAMYQSPEFQTLLQQILN